MNELNKNLFKKNSLCITLIHNNDENRLSLLKPNIENLADTLKIKNNVEINEISWQPDLRPVSFKLGFFRDFIYWKLNRKWKKYIKQPNRFLLFDIIVFIFKVTKKYVFNRKIGKKWLQSSSIEMFVSDKHVRAIFNALEKKFDYLLVFEDDAIFKENSITNLAALLDQLKNKNTNPLYVDLGGGCLFEDLKYDKLEIKNDLFFRYFVKPVTNTACCYLINLKQIEIFGYFLIKMPTLRYIGVDWLFNKIFIMQLNNKIVSSCFHSSPSFFNHGSVTGEFKAWTR